MSHELLGHDAIVAEMLENSRLWIKNLSFEGVQAIDYTTKYEWKRSMASAIAILDECISRICLDKETYDA